MCEALEGWEGCDEDDEVCGPGGQQNKEAGGSGCVMCSSLRKVDAECALCASRLHRASCAIPLQGDLRGGGDRQPKC